MALETSSAIKLAMLLTLSAFVLNVARVLYMTILRPRWYIRHVPLVPDSSAVQTDLVADHDPLSSFRKISRGCSSGPVARYPSLFSPPILITADKVALYDILVSRPYSFPKPAGRIERQFMGDALDKGIALVDGDAHRRQRKIMSPSFGPAHIKSLYPVILDKAHRLRDTLHRAIADADPPPTVNILEYIERGSLDAIASAGFGYEVNSLEEGPENPFSTIFSQLFSRKNHRIYPLLHLISRFTPIPIPEFYFSRYAKGIRDALAAVKRIGNELVDEKKKAATGSTTTNNVGMVAGRDLLSVLVKANMAPGLSPRQRMSDEEVAAQILTFFLAGKSTISSSVSWAIYGLCENPHFQTKLRAEISAVNTESPTYDEVNSLPFLDAVIRETLRTYPILPNAIRVVARDTIVPLSKPYVDKAGNKQTSVRVAENTLIYVPILEMNRNTDFWGSDAASFNPDRWLQSKLPEGARELPSIAMPSFLAGPRACIGFRFALIEMKVIVFTLLKTFKFQLRVPGSDIEADRRLPNATRPTLKSHPEFGWQVPVIVSPVDDNA